MLELERSIIIAADRAIPKYSDERCDVPWWDQEIADARARLSLARKEMARYKNEKTIGLHRALRIRYIGLIRRKKRTSWRKFVTEGSKNNLFGFATKVVREKLRRQIFLETITD